MNFWEKFAKPKKQEARGSVKDIFGRSQDSMRGARKSYTNIKPDDSPEKRRGRWQKKFRKGFTGK